MANRIKGWLCAGLALLSITCILPAARGAEGKKLKALIIGVDGMRADAFEQADAPNLHALMKKGAYSDRAQAEGITVSAPNWSSIMNGVHIDKHGVYSNNYKSDTLKDYPDFFTYLERYNSKLNTVRLITWNDFHDKQPTGADIDLYHNMGNHGDQVMADKAAAILAGKDPEVKVDPDVLFIYFGSVDETGHGHGFSPESPAYMKAIATMDRQAGELLRAVAARPTRGQEQWLILMTSDHGGALDRQHGGTTEDRRTIPFLVGGDAAAPGTIFPAPMNVDVAATVLTWMGVPIDAKWNLDSHAVGLKPSAPPKVAYGTNVIFNGDAEYDGGIPQAKRTSFDLYASGWRDDEPGGITMLNYAEAGAGGNDLTAAKAEGGNVGQHFFAGGPSASPISRMTQTIDLSALKAQIDAGRVQGTLSALLGGWGGAQ